MTGSADTTAMLTFEVAGRRYGLPASSVAAVARGPATTPVPLSPSALLGVAHLQGAVTPVVAMARLIGDAAAEAGRSVIVLREPHVGLTVDRIHAVQSLDTDPDGPEVGVLDLAALLARAFPARGPQPPPRPAQAAAAPDGQSRHDVRAFLEVEVGGQAFAIPLDEVREVVGLPPTTALPGADPTMAGAAEWRGVVLPVICAARALGLAPEPSRRTRLVVVQIAGAPAGLRVDAALGILRVPASRTGPTPPLLNRAAGEAKVDGIIRVGNGRLAPVLPVANILDRASLPSAAGPPITEAAEVGRGPRHAARTHVLLFRLGEGRFALPLEDVVTVLPPCQATAAPGTPGFVAGVFSHRGRLLPLIDQGRRFAGESSVGGKVVVLQRGDLAAGLAVEAVDGVASLSPAELSPAPDLASADGLVSAVIPAGDTASAILLVSSEALLDAAARDLVAARHGGERAR